MESMHKQQSLNINLAIDKIVKHRRLRPYSLGEIKVLLLENIHKVAIDLFEQAGFQVETFSKSIDEAQLLDKLQSVHALGIRSKTKLTDKIVQNAPALLTIGCFCIGTNHVSLNTAARRGISVFNSPFSNSRSVAELIICEIISLARCLGDRNMEMHEGKWNKTAENCKEIRGKTLGIVGYGHIGSQLSVLAESIGMRVIAYDILQFMPLGTAQPMPSLDVLLQNSDFVSLHVPETPETVGMISSRELQLMKEGAYLINASRGSVVDLEALKDFLLKKKLGGAALDVFPDEPSQNGRWDDIKFLAQFPNVILTPHIGGSTEEAQEAIGLEVATNMVKYLQFGCTLGSVNLPEVDLRTNYLLSGSIDLHRLECRLINVHLNVPGVLNQINRILSDFNIDKQICDSRGELSLVVVDVRVNSEEDMTKIYESIYKMTESLSTRIVY